MKVPWRLGRVFLVRIVWAMSLTWVVVVRIWIIALIIINIVISIMVSSSGEDHLEINCRMSIHPTSFTGKNYSSYMDCKGDA